MARIVQPARDVNTRIRDFQLARDVRRSEVLSKKTRELEELLMGTNEQLAQLVAKNAPRTPTAFTRERSQRLRQQISEALAGTRGDFDARFNAFVSDLSESERDAQVELLRRSIGPLSVELDVASITKPRLLAAVYGKPFEGDYLKNWVAKLHEGDVDRVWRAMQSGYVSGRTTDEITRAILGTSGLRYKDGARFATRRGVRGLVRTTTNHLSTVARESVYAENADIIGSVQWVATLDARTTPICQALDGKTFPLGEGPRPPAHWGCRSTTVPLLKGAEQLPARFQRAAKGAGFTGQVPASETYDSWLRKQPLDFQGSVLGKKKAILFRKGAKLDQFVTRAGQGLTVPDLQRLMPDLFRAAGIPLMQPLPSPVAPPPLKISDRLSLDAVKGARSPTVLDVLRENELNRPTDPAGFMVTDRMRKRVIAQTNAKTGKTWRTAAGTKDEVSVAIGDLRVSAFDNLAVDPALVKKYRVGGVVDSVVVDRKTLRIVDGHQRAASALASGRERINVVWVDEVGAKKAVKKVAKIAVEPPAPVPTRPPAPPSFAPRPEGRLPVYEGISKPLSDARRQEFASWLEKDRFTELIKLDPKRMSKDLLQDFDELYAAAKAGNPQRMYDLSNLMGRNRALFPDEAAVDELMIQIKSYLASHDAGAVGDAAADWLWLNHKIDYDWYPGRRIYDTERAIKYAAKDIQAITGKTTKELGEDLRLAWRTGGNDAADRWLRELREDLGVALEQRGLKANAALRKKMLSDLESTVTEQSKMELGTQTAKVAKDYRDSIARLLNVVSDDLIENSAQIQSIKVLVTSSPRRAFADQVKNRIAHAAPDLGDGTTFHEFGHHLEFRNSIAGRRTYDWFTKRTMGKTPSEIYDGTTELGVKNGFYDHYVGKFYGVFHKEVKLGTTEVLSMGIETLGNPRVFDKMTQKDPEHFALIWSIISGI